MPSRTRKAAPAPLPVKMAGAGACAASASIVTTHGESCIADFRRASPDFKGEISLKYARRAHGSACDKALFTEPESGRILFLDECGLTRGLDVFIDADRHVGPTRRRA